MLFAKHRKILKGRKTSNESAVLLLASLRLRLHLQLPMDTELFEALGQDGAIIHVVVWHVIRAWQADPLAISLRFSLN